MNNDAQTVVLEALWQAGAHGLKRSELLGGRNRQELREALERLVDAGSVVAVKRARSDGRAGRRATYYVHRHYVEAGAGVQATTPAREYVFAATPEDGYNFPVVLVDKAGDPARKMASLQNKLPLKLEYRGSQAIYADQWEPLQETLRRFRWRYGRRWYANVPAVWDVLEALKGEFRARQASEGGSGDSGGGFGGGVLPPPPPPGSSSSLQ